jgi:hypothetical protein
MCDIPHLGSPKDPYALRHPKMLTSKMFWIWMFVIKIRLGKDTMCAKKHLKGCTKINLQIFLNFCTQFVLKVRKDAIECQVIRKVGGAPWNALEGCYKIKNNNNNKNILVFRQCGIVEKNKIKITLDLNFLVKEIRGMYWV